MLSDSDDDDPPVALSSKVHSAMLCVAAGVTSVSPRCPRQISCHALPTPSPRLLLPTPVIIPLDQHSNPVLNTTNATGTPSASLAGASPVPRALARGVVRPPSNRIRLSFCLFRFECSGPCEGAAHSFRPPRQRGECTSRLLRSL
jgi:hypothetical protein